MIFSIHIPKTAGSSFRRLLEARYGKGLATYYGPGNANTDSRLNVSRGDIRDALPDAERRGVKLLHTHLSVGRLDSAIDNPADVWVWLRDPVERVLSHYYFLRASSGRGRLSGRVKRDELDLLAFASTKNMIDFQSRYLGRLGLEQLGFVGLTERYGDSVRLLFGPEVRYPRRKWNRTREKPFVDAETRARIAALNPADTALYARAKILLEPKFAALPPATPESLAERLRSRIGF